MSDQNTELVWGKILLAYTIVYLYDGFVNIETLEELCSVRHRRIVLALRRLCSCWRLKFINLAVNSEQKHAKALEYIVLGHVFVSQNFRRPSNLPFFNCWRLLLKQGMTRKDLKVKVRCQVQKFLQLNITCHFLHKDGAFRRRTLSNGLNLGCFATDFGVSSSDTILLSRFIPDGWVTRCLCSFSCSGCLRSALG